MQNLVSTIRSKPLVLIDWSGVISDDQKVAHAVNNCMLADYGHPPVPYEEWRQHAVGGSWKEFFAARGIFETEALAQSFERHFVHVAKEGIKPTCYPDAARFLEEVSRSKSVVVISSHRARFLLEEVEEYGVRQFIGTIYASVHDKAEMMRSVIKSCNLKPEDAMYVADMTYDIEWARKAGVLSVAVASGYHSRERLQAAERDLLVDSLSELRAYFA